MSDAPAQERRLAAGVIRPATWALLSALALLVAWSIRTARPGERRRRVIPALAFGLLASACHHEPAELHGGHEITEVPEGTRFLHADAQGVVRAESDGTGAPVAEATYDAFGDVTYHSGASSSYGTFQRNEVDDVGISDFRARPYDAATGLFLAPDPVPQGAPEIAAESPLDANLYLYAAGRAPNLQDPTGLCAFATPLCWAAIVAGLGEAGITITAADVGLAAAFTGSAAYAAHHETVNRWVATRASRIAQRLARRGRVRVVFATYTMLLNDGSTYSGRTSTIARRGESDRQAGARAVREREQSHHRAEGAAPGAAGEARLDQVSAATVNFSNAATLAGDLSRLGTAYLQIRGREQILIDSYGGARSMANAAGERGTSGNTINGIGLDNPIRGPAIAAAALKWPDSRTVASFVPHRGWR